MPLFLQPVPAFVNQGPRRLLLTEEFQQGITELVGQPIQLPPDIGATVSTNLVIHTLSFTTEWQRKTNKTILLYGQYFVGEWVCHRGSTTASRTWSSRHRCRGISEVTFVHSRTIGHRHGTPVGLGSVSPFKGWPANHLGQMFCFYFLKHLQWVGQYSVPLVSLFLLFSHLMHLLNQIFCELAPERDNEEVRVFLITLSPGEPLWSSFGHSAIWISDGRTGERQGLQLGTFQSTQPNLLGRYLNGTLEYWLSVNSYQKDFKRYHTNEERHFVASRVLLLPDAAIELDKILINLRKPKTEQTTSTIGQEQLCNHVETCSTH